jgi:hypothetical protein
LHRGEESLRYKLEKPKALPRLNPFAGYASILFPQGILIEQPANHAGAGRYTHFYHDLTLERIDRVGGYVHPLSNPSGN